MRSFVRHLVAALLVAAASSAVACAARHAPQEDNESTALGQDGTDANEVEALSSALTATLTLAASGTSDAGAGGGVPSADEIVAAADNTRTFFAPAGCLATQKDPANHQVVYTFNACTGIWGLARVTGTLTAKYSTVTTPTGATLQIDVNGPNLTLNRARASYTATAIVSGAGLTRDMQWTGQLSGITARGRELSRSARWDVQWTFGQSCIRINGSAEGDVFGRVIDTIVTDYQRCRGECPQAGGSIAITDKSSGHSVKITFDGDNKAKFTGIDNKTYEIVLACGL